MILVDLLYCRFCLDSSSSKTNALCELTMIFFFQAEDCIRDHCVTGVQTCALPISGLPIMRPLFLEFPNATTDGHPIDLDSGNEFLFGPRLLIAPSPSPEEIGQYEVNLPPGVWRSEERRVGKECRSRFTPYPQLNER